uniref:Uncharacterized protein LOC104239401 n=1 Tax=Nicotiana sylvestris TaxID=4096 RepID=A0A1U7XRR6_NICSY|nr:PREDICTED: uncharacterized protein LOC104239401 [Nicotiana sylvestris]
MTMTQYEIRFTELACHAVFLVPTERQRFIDGLNYGLRYGMARESEREARFDQVFEIARHLEHACRLKIEEREAKRPRGSGGFGGTSSGGQSQYSKGHPSRPAQAARQIPRGSSVSHSSYSFCLVQSSFSALSTQKSYHSSSAQGSSISFFGY